MYWFTALIFDITSQFQHAMAIKKATGGGGLTGGKKGVAGALTALANSLSGKKKIASSSYTSPSNGGTDTHNGDVPDNIFTVGLDADSRENTEANPLFATSKGEALVTGSQIMDALKTMNTPPPINVWGLMKDHFISMDSTLMHVTATNAELKAEVSKMQGLLEAAGMSSVDAKRGGNKVKGGRVEFSGAEFSSLGGGLGSGSRDRGGISESTFINPLLKAKRGSSSPVKKSEIELVGQQGENSGASV